MNKCNVCNNPTPDNRLFKLANMIDFMSGADLEMDNVGRIDTYICHECHLKLDNNAIRDELKIVN